MRTICISMLVMVLAWVGMIRQTWAIAVTDLPASEVSPTNTVSVFNTFNWDHCYNYKGSSSVAVDHYWILTAAHVADDGGTGNLSINGETYTQQEVIFHSPADDPAGNSKSDLALVRYDKPLPGYYLLHDGEIFHEEGSRWNKTTVYDDLIMVGYGRTGLVTQTTFENGPEGAGLKRWGTNQGSGIEDSVIINVWGVAGVVTTECFHINFNTNNTLYEAGGAQHDSGCPLLINDGLEWKITGINLYISGRNIEGTTTNYNGNYAAMTRDYIGWITNTISDYDTDMDGLPDWWETQYGGDAISMEWNGHSDSDGFTNYEEWLADTIPTDGTSFFEISGYQGATNLLFNSSADRKYQVQYRTDLMNTNETWLSEVDWFNGSGSPTAQAVSITSSNRFYRIRAKLH